MHGHAFDRRGRHEAAEDAGGGVLGVPVVRSRHGEGIVAPPAAAAAAASAADEPRPRATGICERIVTAKRSCPSTSATTRAARWDASSKSPAPSPFAVHAQRGGRLDLHADVAIERHGQRVEPRPEVGRRGGSPGAHGVRLRVRCQNRRWSRDAAGRRGSQPHRDRHALRAERHHDRARPRAPRRACESLAWTAWKTLRARDARPGEHRHRRRRAGVDRSCPPR